MKRHISLFIALTLTLSEASASIIKGQVLVNGDPITAEYTVLSDNTVGLGSGHNASISQYTSGRITVPSKITSGGKTYNVTQIMPLAFRLCDKVKVVINREGTTSETLPSRDAAISLKWNCPQRHKASALASSATCRSWLLFYAKP